MDAELCWQKESHDKPSKGEYHGAEHQQAARRNSQPMEGFWIESHPLRKSHTGGPYSGTNGNENEGDDGFESVERPKSSQQDGYGYQGRQS
jgi:hypothetical protein